jgi:hypothetical protein
MPSIARGGTLRAILEEWLESSRDLAAVSRSRDPAVQLR